MAGKKPVVPSSGSVQPSTGAPSQVDGTVREVWWASSIESERWHFASSVEEAIEEARGYEYDVIYISRSSSELDPALWIDSQRFFEDLDESIENSPADEGWDTYWGATQTHFQELDALWIAAFEQWREKYKFARYYCIEVAGAERVEVPALAVTVADVPGLSTADQTDVAVTFHQTDANLIYEVERMEGTSHQTEVE